MLKWIPKVISLLLLWGSLLTVVVYVEPELLKDILIPNSYAPFIALLSLCLWYTIALFVRKFWASLALALTIVLGIVLSIMKLMHIGLVIALLLTLVIESVYIYRRDEKIQPQNEHKDRGTGI